MGRRADSNVLEDQADPGTVDVPRPTLLRLFLAFLGLGATAFGVQLTKEQKEARHNGANPVSRPA